MAITTLDGALSGMTAPVEFAKTLGGTMVAGRAHSFFTIAGIPSIAPVMTGSTTAGRNLTYYPGQIPFQNPATGKYTYLARFQGQATVAGTLLLCDMLWRQSGYTVTSTSEFLFTNSPDIPARCNDGDGMGTGVYAAVECVTALGNGTPTITVKYVSSAGVSGCTGTNIMATANTPTLGDVFTIGLMSGTTGIRRIESMTLGSTYTSGTINPFLYRVVARLELTGAHIPNAIDLLTGGFSRIYDDSVLFLMFIPSTTTTSNISGQIIFAQG